MRITLELEPDDIARFEAALARACAASRCADEAEVIDVLLGTLAAGDLYADSAREHWKQGGSFRIERREPYWLDRGKFPTLVVHRV